MFGDVLRKVLAESPLKVVHEDDVRDNLEAIVREIVKNAIAGQPAATATILDRIDPKASHVHQNAESKRLVMVLAPSEPPPGWTPKQIGPDGMARIVERDG